MRSVDKIPFTVRTAALPLVAFHLIYVLFYYIGRLASRSLRLQLVRIFRVRSELTQKTNTIASLHHRTLMIRHLSKVNRRLIHKIVTLTSILIYFFLSIILSLSTAVLRFNGILCFNSPNGTVMVGGSSELIDFFGFP